MELPFLLYQTASFERSSGPYDRSLKIILVRITMKKLASLAALAAIVTSAHAGSVAFLTVGLYSNTATTVSAPIQSVLYQLHPGYGNVSASEIDLSGVSLATSTFTTGVGTAKFDVSSLVLDLQLSSLVAKNGTVSANGSWKYVSGTGTYSNQKGSGTFGLTYTPGINLQQSTFTGSLQAVPEPASLAVLGLGAMALVRKRRK